MARSELDKNPQNVSANAQPIQPELMAEIDSLEKRQSAESENNLWDDLRDSLPPWLDEVVAIALLIFGVLSFLALSDQSGAVVAQAWANVLRTLFGYGSWIVAGAFVLSGLLLLARKSSFSVALPSVRLFAIEVAFLCMLGLLHTASGDAELRAVARAGEGGGLIGWGLSALPYWLLGSTPTLVLFGVLFVLSMLAVVGLSRAHIFHVLQRASTALVLQGEKLIRTFGQSTSREMPVPADPSAFLFSRTPLMRIKPDIGSLPPSVRMEMQSRDLPVDEDALKNHPLFTHGSEELKIDYNVIGEMTNRKMADGHRIIQRPDGREKRYFSVSAMQEQKKVGRREKDLPDLDLLQEGQITVPDEQEINHNVVLIENTLLEFDIDLDVVDVQVGPTVTRYAVQPYRSDGEGTTGRTKLSRIASYSSDLALALSAKRLRMELPVPGTNYMGIEVPNKNPSVVTLRSVYESKDYYELSRKNSSPLLVPLGRDVAGKALAIDLAKMPHLLIAGTTGSGKSVAIAAFAVSLILSNPPDRLRMVMLDPKMVELSRFNGVPHLLGPVETDTDRIIGVLKWCTREMDRRYKLLEEHAVRNIDTYNAKFGSRRRGRDYMPHIVILIDEIGDLMMSRPEETETAVTRLAQMARAVGMHLVVATQRPSVDVITGLIKANFPGRISFAVASGVDSRVILDASGAETLLGHGDMLYQAPDASGPKRVQGCFVSDEEVRAIVHHWIEWYEEQIETGKAERVRTGPWERGLTRRQFLAETDPMLEDAIEFVVETQEASASILQRRLGLGYPRAARIVDMLEELGVIGEPVGGGRARKVLIPKGEDPFKRIVDKKLQEKRRQQDGDDKSD